jgi:uridine monophosphate synthetase
MVFLDREEGGMKLLEESGVKLHSLLRISEIAKILYEIGAIDQESLKTIQKQIKKH